MDGVNPRLAPGSQRVTSSAERTLTDIDQHINGTPCLMAFASLIQGHHRNAWSAVTRAMSCVRASHFSFYVAGHFSFKKEFCSTNG
jgi:hypothetical protein